MQPPAALIRKGVHALPCVGDGRQSGTSGSPSILNASPEAAAGGGLALVKTGDRVRIDLRQARGQYPDFGRGAQSAARRTAAARRLPLSEEPDAVAADPARNGGAVRRGHGAEAGGRLPAPRADDGRPAGQSLTAARSLYIRRSGYRIYGDAVMGISIRDPEVGELARTLARLRGTNMTEAIAHALREEVNASARSGRSSSG